LNSDKFKTIIQFKTDKKVLFPARKFIKNLHRVTQSTLRVSQSLYQRSLWYQCTGFIFSGLLSSKFFI